MHRVYRGAAHRNAHSVRDYRYREVGLYEVIATAGFEIANIVLSSPVDSVNMNQLAQNAESHELSDASKSSARRLPGSRPSLIDAVKLR